MVRLWDEMSETRVYEPKLEVFTAEELAEDKLLTPPKKRNEGLIIAWVDGVFYHAPEVQNVSK